MAEALMDFLLPQLGLIHMHPQRRSRQAHLRLPHPTRVEIMEERENIKVAFAPIPQLKHAGFSRSHVKLAMLLISSVMLMIARERGK
jgi:hypothetical protein